MLLRAGDREILIDAIHRPYGEAYAVLPPDERQRLEAAEGRWAGIDLIVATHEHGDHVNPEAVASHLKANTGAVFVSPPAVASQVVAAGGPADRVHSIPYEPGTTGEPVAGVKVLNLRHAGRFTELENIGVIVEVGGLSILHPGDAAPDRENFAPFAEALADLDIALVPPWFTAANPLDARVTGVMHLDPRHTAKSAPRLREAEMVPMTEMLESVSLCPP